MLKSARRGTVTTLASLTAASKAYIVNVGGVSTMQSPGSSTQRMSKSISSSAPQPTCIEEAGCCSGCKDDFKCTMSNALSGTQIQPDKSCQHSK